MQERKPSILIVDDVHSNIKLLSAILNHGHYKIYEALNGMDALELAARHKPTLIILDVMMPAMDGYAVCEKLKQNPDTKDIAVMFVSAKNTTEDKIRGLELGALDFIVKPFQKSEVIARIETHMALQVARRRLNDSELRYAALVGNLQDGIFLWSPSDGVFFTNPSFNKMAGIQRPPSSSIPFPPLGDLVHQDEMKDFESLLLRTLSSEHEQSMSIKLISSRSGDPTHCLCTCSRIFIADSHAAMVTVRDMTERINLERHLSRIQKMEALSLLTAGIAHDFNNLLALINGYAEMLIAETEQGSTMNEKLRCILNAGRSAVSLTKGLLSFGKKRDMHFESLDLVSEIKRVHGFLAKGLPKNVSFNLDFPDSRPFVSADAAMLQQVLMNLCLNSRDAIPSGGTLSISLRTQELSSVPPFAASDAKPGLYAAIEVLDTGLGIPDDIKDKIFDPFFTTKPDGKGTGLGLAMVERIIRSHRGWMHFDSSIGKGSKFTVMIPAFHAKQTKQMRPPIAASATSVKQRGKGRKSISRIAVVDKDETHLAMLQYFLEKEGYQVAPFTSMKTALLSIDSDEVPFSLTIIDLDTSKTEPAKLISRIASKSSDTKTLFLVAPGSPVPLPGAEMLIKPFSISDLLTSLDNIS